MDELKSTGIVRKIDDLGRVVIPKEIRNALRIRVGNPIEIFTDREGVVKLKKYSPIAELSDFCRLYTESLCQSMGHIVAISDKDTIIAVSGADLSNLAGKEISKDLERIIEAREKVLSNRLDDSRFFSITADEEESLYGAQVISPIFLEGDTIGAVILLSKDKNMSMGKTELIVAATASVFISRQLE